MISHVSLPVGDLDRASAFYDAVMPAMGAARVWTGPRGLGYGTPGREQLNLFLQDGDEVPLTAAPGFHLAFSAPHRAAVDAFHAAALAHGGRCAGPPGLRPQYGPDYYAAFVRDPDGHKLEVVHQVAHSP